MRRRSRAPGACAETVTLLPFPRARTKGTLPRVGLLGHVSQLVGRVAGGWPEPRHWQRSRKRASGAAFAVPQRRAARDPASWDGRPASAPLGRSVVGQLGGTGRLGLARPGTATEVREGAPESLRAEGPPQPARARSAVSSVRLIHLGAGGALTRGGLRVPLDQWVVGVPPSVRVGCPGRATDRVRSDPEAPRLAALAGTRRFSYPGWEKLENRSGGFFKGGGGRGARGGPGLLDHLQSSRGAAPPPACPTEERPRSHTPDGTGARRILDLFPLP